MEQLEGAGAPRAYCTPILVVGVQRSGTTWFSRILCSTPGTRYVHEPDNEKQNPVALYLKQRLHRFPYLRAGDEDADFEALWRWALYAAVPPRPVEILLRRAGPWYQPRRRTIYDAAALRMRARGWTSGEQGKPGCSVGKFSSHTRW